MKISIIRFVFCGTLLALFCRHADGALPDGFVPLPEQNRIFETSQGMEPTALANRRPGALTSKTDVLFVVRMPVSWDPEAAKNAKSKGRGAVRGVVAVCSVAAERDYLLRAVDPKGFFPHLVAFADANDLAVITWSNFRGYAYNVSTDEMSRADAKEYDKIFTERMGEWERGFKRILKFNNLPDTNIMAYGISGGAQMIHRIAMRRPDYFAGVHMHVNSSYDIPSGQGTRILWLVTTGECEFGHTASRRFYQTMVDKGYRVIFRAEPNLGHEDSYATRQVSLEFFDYLLTFVPDPSDSNWKAPPVDRFYMMKYPIYVGDYLNKVVYPLEKAPKYIEPQHMVPLPTKPLAQAWGTILE